MPSKYQLAIESLFHIYDKEGILVPFKLNEIQRRIDQKLTTSRRISILKFRQGGVSTYVMARFLVECMTRHTIAVMLTHDKEHTEKLFERAKLMLKYLDGGNLKASTTRENKNELVFKKTDSSFYIGTAGSRDFGRSATITHLHLSEIAFYKDPKRLLTGLLQCVPKSGMIIQETTANGWGTWFQKRFYEYMENRGGFKACFYPWYIHGEYRALHEAVPPFSEYEEWLMKEFNVDLFQLQWRRDHLDLMEGDESGFKQEYPATPEEAFKLSGGSLFGFLEQPTAEERKDWEIFEPDASRLKGHPRKGFHYVFGADSAGGTGNDYSVIVGVCLETLEQVFEYRNNELAPPEFGQVISRYAKIFNNAYIVPESNSHGLAVIYELKQRVPLITIYKAQVSGKVSNASLNIPSVGYGWKTTAISKPYMVGIAQKLLKAGLKIYSLFLFDELFSFSETDEGKLEGLAEHDDTAIAFMLACIGLLRLSRREGVELIPRNLEHASLEEFENEHLKKEKPELERFDKGGRYIMYVSDLFEPRTSRKNVHFANLTM